MASIYQRKDKRWVAQYTDAGGRQKYLYAAKRKEVKAKLDKALEAQKEGLKLGAEKLTLSEYLENWLSATAGTVSESSCALRKLYVRRHIAPVLGHIKLSELDVLTVQTFYQEKHAAGMKPQTVKRMHATLSKALSDAVKFKLVSTNVARDAERPRVTKTEIRALNSGQVSDLLNAARGDRFECFFTVAVACGLRAGENMGLQWADVDFQAGTLRVRRCIHNCKVKPLKSDRSYRTIKLSRTALAALSEQRTNLTVDSEWVYPTATGEHHKTTKYLYKSWYRIKAAAGLPKETRIHDLRHTCATWLVVSGTPIQVVADILGNDPGLCLRVYVHSLPFMQTEAAERMDAALKAAQRPARDAYGPYEPPMKPCDARGRTTVARVGRVSNFAPALA
jgi:integrase